MIIATVPQGFMQVGVLEWMGAYVRVFDLQDGTLWVLPKSHLEDFVSCNEIHVVLLLNTYLH